MKEVKLNNDNVQLLKNNLRVYKERLVMYLVFTGMFLILLLIIDSIEFFQETAMFGTKKLYLLIPIAMTVALHLFYLFKTRHLRKDIHLKYKVSEELKVTDKHTERYGTYSTGNYIAAGSSVIYVVQFGKLTYTINKEVYDKINIEDVLTVDYGKNSNVVFEVNFLR